MYYDGQGEPLVICMEDEGIVFNCAINTQIPSPVYFYKHYLNLFILFFLFINVKLSFSFAILNIQII